MRSVKTIQIGESLMITIPKSFEISINEEYIPLKKENGTLVFVPLEKDYFANAKTGEFYQPEHGFNYKQVGDEN